MTLSMEVPQQQVIGSDEDLLLAPIEMAIDAIRAGEVVILVDDEDRENEGDFVVAASHATTEVVNFMVTHGRGLLCAPITKERAHELNLPAMVRRNGDPHGTAFTVSVDATGDFGVTTGISASDRAVTIDRLVQGSADELRKPGHLFPLVARDGGVLVRRGHTEASVDLARLAGLPPAAVIVEVLCDDGSMARLPDLLKFAAVHGLLVTSIEKLVEFRQAREGVA